MYEKNLNLHEELNIKNNLIINADDFGKDHLINNAIVYCLNNKRINSTSLMIGESGFDEAIGFIQKYEYKNVGLHVNLTDGKPCGSFNDENFLCKDGFWNPKKVWDPKILRKDVAAKFEMEIICQFETMAECVIFPMHINSHNHSHTTPFLFPIFLKVAEKYKVKLRLCQSYKENSYFKYYYRVGINKIIQSKGLAFSESFESIASWNSRKDILGKKNVEIMVHPMYSSDYTKIVDSWDNVDLMEQFQLI